MPRLLRGLQTLVRLADTVSRARASGEVCEAALDCIREQLEIERSAILTFDGGGVLRFRAARGLSEPYRRAVEGHSPWSPDAGHPAPIVVEDVSTDATLGDLRDAVRAEGIERMAFVPLFARGRLVGKLMLYGGAPDRYSAEAMSEAAAVADLIATALDGHEAQEGLRTAHALLSALMESLPEATAFMDAHGRLVYATRRFEAFLGMPPARIIGWSRAEVLSALCDKAENPEAIRSHWDAKAEAGPNELVLLRHVDGRRFELSSHATEGAGALKGSLLQIRDVTERQELESQLLRAQKLESIGRLAGGVAHDFNNMLTAMIGYMDVAAAGLAPESDEHAYITQALAAAEQASGLTRQLLAFARRQPVKPTAQDLNALLDRVSPLLRRLVPENIEIVTRIGAQPGWVLADAGQLEQVLVNLAFNARDAMPDGGVLAMATMREAGGGPGGRDAVILEVRDTGIGMDAETRAHLFEPFYTTKSDGRSSGLGLATVYGIVEQFGGRVDVESAPGRGASFRIVLPAVEAPAASPVATGSLRGHECVLVVEDDASVRGLVGAMLERLGYEVMVAGRADEALSLLERRTGDVHLLIADTVMPGISGRELATRLLAARPGLRVLLMSGYATSGGEPHAPSGFAFMPKPFSIETLARRVRETLASPPLSPAPR